MNDPRSAVPEGKDTIRTKIVQAVLDHAEVAPFDVDEPDGVLLFEFVGKGTLEDIPIRQTPGLAVEEGPEQIIEGPYQCVTKRLRLFFHLKVVKVNGIDPDPVINYYFHRIAQLFVTTTTHFADLAMDIAEAGNSIQTNGSTDPEPGGTIYLDVDYRHARGDHLTE
jgi:hypothetical protein